MLYSLFDTYHAVYTFPDASMARETIEAVDLEAAKIVAESRVVTMPKGTTCWVDGIVDA